MGNKEVSAARYVSKPTKKCFIFIIVFLCIGIGMIVGISVHRSQETAKISRYIITTGTIVDYKVTAMNKGEVHKVYGYAEIAEFEVDGVTYTATNSISSIWSK